MALKKSHFGLWDRANRIREKRREGEEEEEEEEKRRRKKEGEKNCKCMELVRNFCMDLGMDFCMDTCLGV